jgi:hypothetical protein
MPGRLPRLLDAIKTWYYGTPSKEYPLAVNRHWTSQALNDLIDFHRDHWPKLWPILIGAALFLLQLLKYLGGDI